eukprot:TRINITY_DN12197_c0_g1_i2.p3 TRINITY_DN12197_c0_g1~~TRINITY_DN12197_c0_g1_i2.p3  ORF type:complete len:234 (+),score=46.36 TRINITY_DN12197_c0_g1_i2:81-704(+)
MPPSPPGPGAWVWDGPPSRSAPPPAPRPDSQVLHALDRGAPRQQRALRAVPCNSCRPAAQGGAAPKPPRVPALRCRTGGVAESAARQLAAAQGLPPAAELAALARLRASLLAERDRISSDWGSAVGPSPARSSAGSAEGRALPTSPAPRSAPPPLCPSPRSRAEAGGGSPGSAPWRLAEAALADFDRWHCGKAATVARLAAAGTAAR